MDGACRARGEMKDIKRFLIEGLKCGRFSEGLGVDGENIIKTDRKVLILEAWRSCGLICNK